jgi:hypothetical protein
MGPPAERELSGYGTFHPDGDDKPPISVLIKPWRRPQYQIGWVSLWQGIETGISLMEQAEMESPLTRTEYRVRDILLGSIGFGNWALVNQAEIARRLRVGRAKVSHAIKRLVELNIILQGEKMGRNSEYMVSPAFCFKGKIEEGQKLARQAEKQHRAAKIIPFSKQLSLLE